MVREIDDREKYFYHLASVPVPIVIAKAEDGTIVYVNTKAEELWMRNAEDLVGRKQPSLHPESLNERVNGNFSKNAAALRLGESIVLEKSVVLRSDGHKVPVDIFVRMVDIEETAVLVAVFISIESKVKTFEELRHREQEFKTIFENSQVGILYLKNGRYLYRANQRLAEIMGYDSPDEIEGMPMEKFHLSHEHYVWFGKHHYNSLRYHKSIHIEYEVKKKNGEPIWVRLSGKAVDPNIPADLDKGVIWIVDDISDFKELEEKLRAQNERLENLLENINGISWEFDLKTNRFAYVSPNAEKILGYKREEWTDLSSWKSMLHPEDREAAANYCTNETKKGNNHTIEYRMIKKDGSVIWVLDIVSVWKNKEGKPEKLYGFILDISQQKEYQLRLEEEKKRLQEALEELQNKSTLLDFQAHHDALTGLPNRTLFYDRVEQAIQKAKRSKKKFVVLFIDLDRFKEVNDSFGHDIGDELLLEVSRRLRTSLREEDTLARLGGDEFTVLLENIEKLSDVTHIAQKLIDVLRKPFEVEGRTFYLTCSIGISIYPDDGVTTKDLLKFADNAMYKAKEEGRDNFRFYTKEMTEIAFERIMLESSIRQALEKDEFTLYYQPQYQADTKEIIGMEALIRWNHPEFGLIPPSKFIPLAEESSLIVDIDNWVMKNAMKQVSKWRSEGLEPGILSLNLAIKHLESPTFMDTLQNTLQMSGCSGQWLKLEVLERDVMKNPQKNIEKLNALHETGIKLALDDFGTGQSSLAYLKRFPLDELKIDRSFVQDIQKDEDDDAIVLAIIALAKSLGLEIIAEGVETKEQLDFLLQHGCNKVQGYYFSPPVDSWRMEQMLKENI